MPDRPVPPFPPRSAPPGLAGDGYGLPTGARPQPRGPETGEMPFLDHLEELRWRLIKAGAAVVLMSGACLFFADWIIDALLLGPTKPDFFMYRIARIDAVGLVLQNRTITGQFFAYVGTVLASGIILAFPLIIYQFWRFIEPGLYKDEKQGLRFAAVFASFFFALGISFGYLIITPLALQFFTQFEIAETIVNEFDITKYFSMVLTWCFGAGLLFELPVAVFFLAKLGVVGPEGLRTGRKYAVVVILVLSAFLTPPDPFSQVLMSGPLFLLYELAIVLAGAVERGRQRKQAKEAARAARA